MEAPTPKFGPVPFSLSSEACVLFTFLLLIGHCQHGHKSEERTKAQCVSQPFGHEGMAFFCFLWAYVMDQVIGPGHMTGLGTSPHKYGRLPIDRSTIITHHTNINTNHYSSLTNSSNALRSISRSLWSHRRHRRLYHLFMQGLSQHLIAQHPKPDLSYTRWSSSTI